MDDKVFIFFILIPGGVTLINFLLLRKTRKGKRLFYILTGIIVAYFVIAKILTSIFPNLVHGLSGAVAILAYWYLLMIVTMIISIAFSISAFRKKEK